MSKKDFETFLKKHASADMRDKAIDWDREKQDWLGRIDEFYGTVQEWLKEYIDDGKIQISFDSIILNEDHIGSYETKKLHLRLASQEVVFSPIGTILVGAKGRIDMTGIAGKVRFVLVDKESEGTSWTIRISTGKEVPKKKKDKKPIVWTWKISTPPPSIKYIEMNPESFFDTLLKVMNA